jgi:ankyrin repeat protein
MARWNSLDQLLELIDESSCWPFDPPVTVHSRRSDGDTPLHVAAVWGDVVAIELLLRAGADIDAIGDMSRTPLHNAIGQRHLSAAKFLAISGAAIDIVDEFGQTAVQAAASRGMTGLFSDDSAG